MIAGMNIQSHRAAVAQAQEAVNAVTTAVREADSITDELRTSAEQAIANLDRAKADLALAERVEEEATTARAASEIATEAAQASRMAESPTERMNAALRSDPRTNPDAWRSQGDIDGRVMPAIDVNLIAANSYRDAIRLGVTGDEIVRAASHGMRMDVVNGDVRTVNISNDAQGGYLVPTTLSTEIIRQIWAGNSVREAGARIIRTSGKGDHNISVLTFDPSSEAKGTDDDITAESGSYDTFQPTWAQRTFKAHKLTTSVPLTEESIADTMNDIGAELGGLMGQIIRFKEQRQCLTGDSDRDADAYQGLLTAPHASLPAIPRTTVGKSGSVAYTDLDAAMQEFTGDRSDYDENLTLLWKRNLLAQVLRQVGANYGFLFQQASNGGGLPRSYEGIPAVDCRWLPTPGGTANQILAVIGNFNRLYGIREVQALQIMVNPYVRMANGETVYFANFRGDGKILDNRAGQFIVDKA